MQRFRDLPLGRKLVVVAVAASGLALAVSSATFLIASFVGVRDSVGDELRVQASIIADNTAETLAFQDPKTAAETMGALHATSSVDLACLYDDQQKIFAIYPADATACPERPPADGELREGGGQSIVQPVSSNDHRYGTLYIKGNFDQGWERLALQAFATLVAILLGVLAAVVLSSRLQRVISRPILELSATASTISRAGDYSLRAPKRTDDEIGDLVDSFNGMVAEVERRDVQLRAASRLKDEFLAALSHELRTPLNAMLGWIQVLRTGKVGPDIMARAHESIERNARAQATLIEDLLDVSRIVTGKLNLQSDTVEVTAVIEAALEVVRPAAEAKEIVIRRQLPAAPQYVVGDAARLQQIAWNLLSNAVKFTPKNGHVDVTLATEGDNYVLQVRDDGIGIEPGFLPHVFDRFRQADGSFTRRHGGLGLGLAIVRDLTELHGGQVTATSEGAGKGATFRVTLPRPAGLAATPGLARAIHAGRLDGLSILVVDDDEDARQLTSIAVSRAGASVVTADSAGEAIRALANRRFDVILSDLAMPGLDGFEFVRAVRAGADPGVSPIAAIAVTAHAGLDAEIRARANGFNAVVTKPYDLDVLFSEIRRALSHDVVP